MSGSSHAAPDAGDQPTANSMVAGDVVPTVEGIARRRLDELTRQAVEDGLYDVDADAYREALAQARKQP